MGQNKQQPQSGSTIPAGCPDEGICKFKDEPEEPDPKGETLKNKRDKLENRIKTYNPVTQEPQIRGDKAEMRAIDHNSQDHGDNKGVLKSGDDIGRSWKCEACQRAFEIDHILRDKDNKIVAIAEIKSGGNLRSNQGAVQAVLAKQIRINLYKKVQHKDAIRKCENNGIPHIDMSSTPAP